MSLLVEWRGVNTTVGDNALALIALPGVGRKTAERILVEVRDRLDAFNESLEADNNDNNIQNDAILGLISLGYKRSEAVKFVEKLDSRFTTSQEIIRQVLKNVLSNN